MHLTRIINGKFRREELEKAITTTRNKHDIAITIDYRVRYDTDDQIKDLLKVLLDHKQRYVDDNNMPMAKIVMSLYNDIFADRNKILLNTTEEMQRHIGGAISFANIDLLYST